MPNAFVVRSESSENSAMEAKSALSMLPGEKSLQQGGRVAKRYLFELVMAPRVASTAEGATRQEAPSG